VTDIGYRRTCYPADVDTGTYWARWGYGHLNDCGPVKGFVRYQQDVLAFHKQLNTGKDPHSYQSHPIGWLVLYRPVAYWYVNPSTGVSQAIVGLGTPAIWWASIPALLVVLWRWATTRDWRAAFIIGGFAANYIPWFWSDIVDHRTMFFFYALPMLPFMCLALAYCCGLATGGRRAGPDRRMWGHPRRGRLPAARGRQLRVALSGAVRADHRLPGLVRADVAEDVDLTRRSAESRYSAGPVQGVGGAPSIWLSTWRRFHRRNCTSSGGGSERQQVLALAAELVSLLEHAVEPLDRRARGGRHVVNQVHRRVAAGDRGRAQRVDLVGLRLVGRGDLADQLLQPDRQRRSVVALRAPCRRAGTPGSAPRSAAWTAATASAGS
jgi:hypothetical protein